MNIPKPLLLEFGSFVELRTGLCLQPRPSADLARGLRALARELHCADAGSCVRALMAAPPTPELVGRLARHFTTGETYFFRGPAVFNALEYEVLPPLIHARRAGSRHLRIWSAGCCTGEEPYSLAILLDRLIPDIGNWRITLLATDINPAFLDKARQGGYRDWSFRNAPETVKRSHFEMREPGSYAIAERIKRLVRFDYLNLADDTYPDAANNTADMDIVMCRNVLMYFDVPRAMEVIRRLHRALVPGGWLIVSPAETGRSLFPQFTDVHFPDAMFYRKMPGQEAVPARAPAIGDRMPESPRRETGGNIMTETAIAPDVPDMPPSPAVLARSHADHGQLDDALRWCEAAIAADKSNPELRYLRAMIFQEQGRCDAAIQSLKQALFLDRDFVLAHFALGSLCRRRGQMVEAARHFSNAAALLGKYAPGDTLPESGGMTAARLSEIIRATEAVS